MEICSRTGQALEDKMAHVHRMLNTTRICNIYCFSKGTIISRNASLLRYKNIAYLFNFGLRVPESYIIIGSCFQNWSLSNLGDVANRLTLYRRCSFPWGNVVVG